MIREANGNLTNPQQQEVKEEPINSKEKIATNLATKWWRQWCQTVVNAAVDTDVKTLQHHHQQELKELKAFTYRYVEWKITKIAWKQYFVL